MFHLRGSGETAVNHWHEKGFSVSRPTAKKCSLNIPGAPKTTSLRGATWPNRVQDEARGTFVGDAGLRWQLAIGKHDVEVPNILSSRCSARRR